MDTITAKQASPATGPWRILIRLLPGGPISFVNGVFKRFKRSNTKVSCLERLYKSGD